MPFLEIHRRSEETHPSEEIQTLELARDTPVSIGRAESNDIQVLGPAVGAIHCRISAKGSSYLVTAATPSGVLCNGTTVVSAKLSSGDTLEIGDVQIVFLADRREDAGGPGAPDSSSVGGAGPGRQPASDQIELRATSSNEVTLPPFAPIALPTRPRETSLPRGTNEPLLTPAQRAAAAVLGPADVKSEHTGAAARDSYDDIQEIEQVSSGGGPASRKPGSASGSRLGRLGMRPVRPGEQDVLRSPLVLGLGGGALALLLTAATLWFVLGRETAQRKFDAAQNNLNSGLYAQAIEGFEAFLKDHPQHKLSADARVALGTARVDQAIAGSTPAWDRGLDALNQFIAEYKDAPELMDSESVLRQFVVKSSGNIAVGAALAAKTGRKKSLLGVSAEATRLLESYASTESPPLKLLEEIAAAVRGAQAAILRQETFDASAKVMDAALAKKHALAAFDSHRRLLERYNDFIGFRPLDERLQKAIAVERALVVREELPRDAATEPRSDPLPAPPLVLANRTRTSSQEASLGDTVIALAEDCCYGIDTVTGELMWRRVIGLDAPFFPVSIAARVPALLLFDARYRDLLLVEQRSGKLLWRQPLQEVPAVAPLIHAGQILQAMGSGQLYQIDLGTGKLSVRLKFSQPVSGPPVLSHSGDRLYLAGRQSVLYVLKRSPLACDSVAFLGHAPGAVGAPLLMLRSYLLIPENDRLKSCKLRLLDTSAEDKPPLEIASLRIDGQVHDAPVVRGKQLFVPSSPERIHVFTVSETRDRHSLKLAASYQVKSPHGGPLFLAAGPDDQMWMAGSALRKFQLVKDSLRADKQQLAVGLCTQPLQVSGESLFLGRRLPYSRAVFFTEADRQRMVGKWQVALGGTPLEFSGPGTKDGTVACVTSTGAVYLLTAAKLQAGGIELQPAAQLAVPEELATPLRAARLADGRLAVHCGGARPRLWLVTAAGLVQQEHKLPKPLEADPLPFAGGLLLPSAGKLSVLGQTPGSSPIEDFVPAITKKTPPRWRSVTRLDEAQVIAVNAQGRVARLQYRTSPVAHLAEVVHWDAGSPVDLDAIVDRGRVFVADAAGRLSMLDANSLEPRGEVQLGKPARQSLWFAGGRLLVEAGNAQLVCLDGEQTLQKQWSIPLPPGVSLAGAPLALQEDLIVALRSGQIWKLNAQTGEIQMKFDLEQPLAFGPRSAGESLIVGTLDGSLLRLNPIVEPAK